jgi:hypothetical protein
MNACPKCRSPMELGFVADHGYGNVIQALWVEGELIRGVLGAMTLRGKRQLAIAIERCTGRGYLESYARA